MMLYTGKGDNGTTKTINSGERISKSSSITEALGNLDELNSYLGLVKVWSRDAGYSISETPFESIVEGVQQNIFTICASLAGSDKELGENKITEVESIIALIEAELPPIKVFSIPGGSELAASYDFARTLARRAERRVVALNDSYSAEATQDKESKAVNPIILKYLNRLSSLLFALARLTNLRSGINESAPSYN
jgi:cob(I)alamin adenosyltransferase